MENSFTSIESVKINGLTDPMGYCIPIITVSWRVSNSESPRQKSSQVLIAADPEMRTVLSSKRGNLPCSGTVMELKLKPRTTYYVQVSVEGSLGERAVSEVTSFDTGKIDEPWQAQWIGMPENCAFHPILFKTFAAKQNVKRARLYITGVGLYEASINGQKVGDDFLAPFFNDYNCAIQVQTYDVTQQLAGENTLSILLGNGWYKGRLGYEGGVSMYGKQFAALAELHIEYSDGTEAVVCTDDTWTAQPSDVTYSDIYDGEGWDRTAYADRPVYPVVNVDMSGKALTDRYSMPLHVMEEVTCKEVITTPAGETVLDFGQNFAGFVSFRVKDFAPGTKITLEHGEVLQNGNFYHDNYRTAKTLITYVSDGREEWFAPHFTYTGFRYVKVTGWPTEINPADFVGKVVYSAMERTGWLETGHKKVNQLFSNAVWGLKSNFLDMPTDCPQRDERLGWTGDAQVFAPTASFFMDTKAFYRKFLWDMRNDQVKHDGAVASYLPGFGWQQYGAAAWADAATFIPETVYKTFGDLELLRENYPLMKDWVDSITRRDIERGQTYLYNFNFTFGDWLAMDGVTDQSMKGGTEDAYVSSVYYYASTKKVAAAAKVLGCTEDETAYNTLAENIRAAILHEYFTPAGRLAIDTQTGYIAALYFGIWVDKAVLQQGLRSRMKRDGNRLKGGFVGAPLTCETLAENGMMDLAMHLFLQEKFPSWLHCVNLGATTIWERWNSLLDDGSISGTGMNSLNHYAYGSVVNFAVRYIAGFQPLTPGYQKVRITPYPDARLGKMDLTYTSPSGKYAASWKICKDGKLALHYEIPFDCEAEVVLPESGDVKNLTAGTYDFLLEPQRDYRNLYTMDTMLDEVVTDQRVMDILREELPTAYGMGMGGDIESLSMTFRELASAPWFGCPAHMVEKAMTRMSEIKAELGE